MSGSGEFDWIERHFAPLAGDGSFGLKDDAAHLSKACQVITHDTILEGIHFVPSDPAWSVAIKALRVNISDCVAKGSKPAAYLIGLGVPDRWENEDVGKFADGLKRGGGDLQLLGGDTYRSPGRLCVSVTMIGDLVSERYVSRLGAEPDQVIAVNGPIGDAAIGLRVALGELDADELSDHFLKSYREPPDQSGFEVVVSAFASASMDLSDGLLGDCAKLCDASNVSARINLEDIPRSKALEKFSSSAPVTSQQLYNGGDDYRVLMTLPRSDIKAATETAASVGFALTVIGSTEGRGRDALSLFESGEQINVDYKPFSHR